VYALEDGRTTGRKGWTDSLFHYRREPVDVVLCKRRRLNVDFALGEQELRRRRKGSVVHGVKDFYHRFGLRESEGSERRGRKVSFTCLRFDSRERRTAELTDLEEGESGDSR